MLVNVCDKDKEEFRLGYSFPPLSDGLKYITTGVRFCGPIKFLDTFNELGVYTLVSPAVV